MHIRLFLSSCTTRKPKKHAVLAPLKAQNDPRQRSFVSMNTSNAGLDGKSGVVGAPVAAGYIVGDRM
jgi:hypothetical protein